MVEIPGRIIIDPGGPREYRCSFCGKSQQEVERLIAGPRGVYICNECVELCKEIISEEKPKAETVEMNGNPVATPSGWRPTAPGQATANIIRAGHIEFLVTDLARAREFYVNLLGFVETEADDGHIYLRGLEERYHHSLLLTKAEQPGVAHLAYRVATADDLDALAAMAEAHGLPHRWVEPGEEVGQGCALRIQDPGGIPTEFYAEMVSAERLLQRFDLYRGAHIMRIDHFNIQVPDCQRLTDWYMRTLGFRCSEYTGTEDDPERLWAAWLHRKGSVHDVAIMNGVGPRVHHGAWSLPDAMAVLRCCDVLAGASSADAIERGPGRHGIANALFLYLRDPDGNRVELYASDYLTVDPDFAPIRWTLNDPRRQTLWGHYVPRCWFEEAMRVQSINDNTFVPTHEPQMTSTPTYVH